MANLSRAQLAIVVVSIAAIVVAGSRIAWHKVRSVPAPGDEEFFVGEPVESPPPAPIVVQVSGEVARPGLYELPQGARVDEALAAAGGCTEAADTSRLNLAALLLDGDRVHVPQRIAEVPAAPPGQAWQAPPEPGEPVSINHGTLEELQRLPGVGPEIARRIVEYRQRHGPFRSLEQLKEVSGIGDKKLDKMRPMLSL